MSYVVLARKYRPNNFDELIGQEVLVQTLSNAIRNQKIAHAFILTGIRGVGKTTTARIIAKALNCLGEDGNSDIARMPCGVCSNCSAISKSSHPDVLEIDAASKTGVDDVRVLIDSVQYSPAAARYKVFIIDEVHMLSNSAFNALLKTLEEPPSHVKFVFATTEIRKVPITVLSRCQRFDLRRLDAAELAVHLRNVLTKENFTAEDLALNLISESADGSVRDLLSITDRVLSCNNYDANLTAAAVEEVLGLNDKNKVIDLFTKILEGDINGATQILEKFYELSTDLMSLLVDLQRINHIVLLSKTTNYKPQSFSSSALTKISDLAAKASVADLTRTWQMLTKGATEIAGSNVQKIAFEMLIIRMCYISSLPNLDQILSQKNAEEKNGPKINTLANIPDKTIAENSKEGQDLIGEVMRNFAGAKVISE